MNRAGWSVLSLVALAACGGGYDAEYDCEQGLACQERITGQDTTEAQLDACVAVADDAYDDAGDSTQDLMDDTFEACEDKKACAYFVCACDYLGVNTPQCQQAREYL